MTNLVADRLRNAIANCEETSLEQDALAEIERLTRERDGLRAALIDISIAESIGRAQRIAILATTEPAQVEPTCVGVDPSYVSQDRFENEDK